MVPTRDRVVITNSTMFPYNDENQMNNFCNIFVSIEILLDDINKYNSYWEQTRCLYAPFECTTSMRSGNSDVYLNEIPGGQYTNLQFQAFSLGLSDQFAEVKQKYIEADNLLGNIVKVYLTFPLKEEPYALLGPSWPSIEHGHSGITAHLETVTLNVYETLNLGV